MDVAPLDECTRCSESNLCNSDCGLLCKKSCDRCPESMEEDERKYLIIMRRSLSQTAIVV